MTGGAGFIGSHVAGCLLDRGHEVAVVDDLSRGDPANVPDGVRLYRRDVRGGCEDVLAEVRPEAVSHHAAQVDVRRSVSDPALDAEANVLGTLRLLDGCVRHGVRRFVFASTGGAIYGEQTTFPAPEDHPRRPVSPYGVSKLAAENYLGWFHDHHGLRYRALRYANVYGPRQRSDGEGGVVAIFASRLAAGEPCAINGDGEQTRDFVYVGDVARANALALEAPEGDAPSGAYNVGTGVEASVNELYAGLRRLSGRDGEPQRGGPAVPGEQRRSSVDPSKARLLLGWQPGTDLAAGLRETLRFFGADGNTEHRVARGGV